MALPGIPKKVHIPTVKTGSPKAAIAANLGSATRATGASYGIFAQRSVIGSGLHLNNFAYNSASISATRHALNDNRPMLFNNVRAHNCNNNNNTYDNMMKLMMLQQMLGATAQSVAGIVDSVKANKDTDKNSDLKIPTDKNSDKAKDKSLSEINKLVEKANENVASFGRDYSRTEGLSEVNATITDVKSLLQSAGVEVNISDINLSEINLTADSSLDDIDVAIETIQNTDIAGVDSLTGSLGSAISNIDAQLKALAGDTDNAAANTEKIRQLQSAKAKLETLRDNQLPKLKTNLTAQKDKLSGIRQEKADAMDKLYAQAQADDAQIGKNNKEMETLKGEIEKETNDKKKKKLIEKYNGLADANKTLETGLKELGNITNSHNETLTLNNTANTTHYTDASQPDASNGGTPSANPQAGTPPASNGGANRFTTSPDALEKNTKLSQQFNEAQNEGDTVEINGQTYTKLANGKFKGPEGREWTSMQLMSFGLASNIFGS